VRSTSADEFREWVAGARQGMRQTAFLLSGDWFLADDLVQDALTRLFAVWGRVTSSGDPAAYARRVLLNIYLDHQRRPSRREESRAELPDVPAPDTDPVARDHRDHLLAALREVPPGQRAVLVLRYWEDLSVEQTAAALSISSGNVKSQSSRGLDNLRVALAAATSASPVEPARDPS